MWPLIWLASKLPLFKVSFLLRLPSLYVCGVYLLKLLLRWLICTLLKFWALSPKMSQLATFVTYFYSLDPISSPIIVLLLYALLWTSHFLELEISFSLNLKFLLLNIWAFSISFSLTKGLCHNLTISVKHEESHVSSNVQS